MTMLRLNHREDNIADIAQWRQELAGIPNRMRTHTVQIAEFQTQLGILVPKLETLITMQINPATQNLATLNARIQMLTLPPCVTSLTAQIQSHLDALTILKPLLQNVTQELAPIDAQIQKYNSATAIIRARQAIDEKTRECHKLQLTVTALENEAVWLLARRKMVADELYWANSKLSQLQRVDNDCDSCDLHGMNDGDVLGMIITAQGKVSDCEAELDRFDRKLTENAECVRQYKNRDDFFKDEIRKLKQDIAQRNRDVSGFVFTDNIGELQRQLEMQYAQRSAPERERADLQAQIDGHQQAIATLKVERDNHNANLRAAEPLARRYASQNDVAILQQLFDQQQREMEQLVASRSALQHEIYAQQNMIQQGREELDHLRLRQAQLHAALAYQHAVDRFTRLLSAPPKKMTPDTDRFFKTGFLVLASIERQKAKAVVAGAPPFNGDLHVEMLNTCSDLLHNPADHIARARLSLLARQNDDGKPSVIKRVIGCIGLFLAAAVAVAGGLILAGVLPVVSLSASITCIAGGVTLFAGGAALLVSARRKGLDKELYDFEELSAKPQVSGSVLPADENLHEFQQQPQYATDARPDQPVPSAPAWGL
jgi:hypothetical protein